MKNIFGFALIGITLFLTSAFVMPEGVSSSRNFAKQLDLLNHSTTVVVHKNGKRVGSGYKVSLEFSTGFTKSFYTNSDGIAYVTHSSEGNAKVYINGNWSSHATKGRAPGKILVYL